MKTFAKIVFILLAVGTTELKAQVNPEVTFRIENGKMILTLDLRWNAIQRYNVAKNFDIDSIAIEKAYTGVAEVTSKKDVWKVRKVNATQIELYKALDNNPVSPVTANDIFMMDDNWLTMQTGTPSSFSNCGINKLKQSNIFTYQDGVATFFLPSYKNAQKVYLSGSFNDWSTLQTPMYKADSGWVTKIKLVPGKYPYKYIIDGRWREDPNNYNRDRNAKGWNNSVIFCTNYAFHLKGRSDAKKVVLAGSFNNWAMDDYRMIKTKDGWKLPIYLCEGTYAYKFIVDGQWITDPDNKDVRSDGDGNMNSFMGIGESYFFMLKGYSTAHKVILSGSFNNWSTNELVMTKTATGWELPYILAPGTYEYKFIVDGQWITDPANPLKSGSGDYINSVLTFKPNYTFTLSKFPDAHQVCVSGSFNGWNKDGYRMYKKDGKWMLPVYLKPGKYLYKFVVDGEWYIDPDNKLWEENEYGTGNSVLWINQ
ncbi:MAG: hypothetical protein GYA22_09945 [Bacteroidales bacterium]|nr:hypothetical protein [Bacteroidales bacterium]